MKRPISAFAAYCVDAPGSEKPRREQLEAHLRYVEQVMDRLLVAGPLKDASGTIIGSLIVFGVHSEAEARTLLDEDPYYRSGVWQEITISRFLPVAGALVGGRNW